MTGVSTSGCVRATATDAIVCGLDEALTGSVGTRAARPGCGRNPPAWVDRARSMHHPELVSPVIADELSTLNILTAVADPLRWQIVHALAAEELCTTHLQELLGAKQTLVSHHLKVLRDAGLVDTAPCGRFTYYRLRPDALDPACDVLAALAEAARAVPARRAC